MDSSHLVALGSTLYMGLLAFTYYKWRVAAANLHKTRNELWEANQIAHSAEAREARTRKMNVLLHGFVRDNARLARHMLQLGHKVWDLENANDLFDSQQERIEIVAGTKGIPLDF